MTPPWEELFCYIVVAGYIAWQWRQPSRHGLVQRLLLIATAAWLTEETCIRLYDFYAYSSDWMLFIGRVPLAVVVVWPVVIHSAGVLARHLRIERLPLPVITGVIVFTDAALIEPVAVRSGLWGWNEPGLFAVPPIAIVGWAVFAALAQALLNGADRHAGNRWRRAATLLVAPLATHGVLLALWWGGWRWFNGTLPAGPVVAVVWVVSAVATGLALRRPASVPMAVLLQRLPGALFFFALLAMRCRSETALMAYAGAFALPYLALCGVALRREAGAVDPAGTA